MLAKVSLLFCIFIINIFSLMAREIQGPAPLEIPNNISFGQVNMGEQAHVSFRAQNIGPDELIISRIHTSCGCTIAKPSSVSIPVGGNVLISIEVDTSQKLGQIKKTARIYLENYRLPLTFIIDGLVFPQSMQHQKIENISIFSEKCASCHSLQGNYRQGLQLYLADCASCHGTLRQGATAPSLLAKNYREDWLQVIQKGRNNMAGFDEQYGGPLVSSQISSLQQFLKNGHQPRNGLNASKLYKEYCSSCHGDLRMGPIGPDIRPSKLQKFSKVELEKILAEGLSNPLMPSFLIENGAWMSREEVKKLVEFLKEEPEKTNQ